MIAPAPYSDMEETYDVLIQINESGRATVSSGAGGIGDEYSETHGARGIGCIYGDINAGPNQRHEIALLINAWRNGYYVGKREDGKRKRLRKKMRDLDLLERIVMP